MALYPGITLDEATRIPAETVCELVNTLRYLASEHAGGCPIDAINMMSVTRTLAHVEALLTLKVDPVAFRLAAE